ncbi:MAG: SWIM zinc finger family protein [Candidatus Poribacteria bacterium]|nr:SWIM zinc finger family protein [Candidatus Poribacteria bacterium]
MTQFSRTWWGVRFIDALEQITDPGRLGRGRSYARNGKIIEFHLSKGKINAKVRGSINPYFGVYKEPLYQTTIGITPIPKNHWSKLIKSISSKAAYVSKLLMNEMPENIEDAFSDLSLSLLPRNRKDFKTSCSCPDWDNPCKHIAGVYYLAAREFDRDPFLIFQLRGLSKEELQSELAKSPLGQILLSQLKTEDEIDLAPSASYYTKPAEEPVDETSLRAFWTGAGKLPQSAEARAPSTIPAVLIKKGGDYPSFWDKDVSFVTVMERFYEIVRRKNRKNW